jgi:hypothetical protein
MKSPAFVTGGVIQDVAADNAGKHGNYHILVYHNACLYTLCR